MRELKDYSLATVKQKLDELSNIHCDELKRICLELATALAKNLSTKVGDPKYLGIPNISFSLVDPDDARDEEFSKQRIERGFDASELWSLKDTITDFILPRLKAFADYPCGYPGCLDNENAWVKILNKMIRAFEIIKKDTEFGVNSDEEWEEWEDGMSLFHEYFNCLWT